MSTPLSKVKNFGPETLPELESLGLNTLEDLQDFGWEEVCRKWVESYPERLNANAFVGIITAIEGSTWMKATASQRAQARNFAKKLKLELKF